MNKNSLVLKMFLLLFPLFMISCEKESLITEDKLPAKISEFLQTHFEGKKVLQVLKDKELVSTSHVVLLEGNVRLDFDGKDDIEEIESSSKLPDSVIPIKLLDYVQANLPSSFVIGWEKEDKNQEIQLNTGEKIEFNMDGVFLRFDFD